MVNQYNERRKSEEKTNRTYFLFSFLRPNLNVNGERHEFNRDVMSDRNPSSKYFGPILFLCEKSLFK